MQPPPHLLHRGRALAAASLAAAGCVLPSKSSLPRLAGARGGGLFLPAEDG